MARNGELAPEVFEGGVARYLTYIAEKGVTVRTESGEEMVEAIVQEGMAALAVNSYLEEHDFTGDEANELAAHAFLRLHQRGQQVAGFGDDTAL